MNAETLRRGIDRMLTCWAIIALTACGGGSSDEHAQPVGEGSTTTPTESAGSATLGRTTVRITRIASVPSPTSVVSRAGSENLYVTSQSGAITVLVHQEDGRFIEAPTPLIDLSDRVGSSGGERGLLGLAFSPDGTQLITSYTDGNDNGASVLERYNVNGEVADLASRVELMRTPQPFANHNGGNVVFGPDGYLWYGLGDGGGQGDPDDNGQNPKTRLATIMRIDALHRSASSPYTIPKDNPFASGRDALPEVWLYGVRNPWRFSFDSDNGDLWIGDVGGSAWEEIDLLPAATGRGKGANLGWSLREGAHDTEKSGDRPADLVDPIFEFDHTQGSSITGGFVYRGTKIPDLQGVYLYSDYGTSTLRALRANGTKATETATLATTGEPLAVVVSFGEDHHHELYAAELGGLIVRLDPA